MFLKGQYAADHNGIGFLAPEFKIIHFISSISPFCSNFSIASMSIEHPSPGNCVQGCQWSALLDRKPSPRVWTNFPIFSVHLKYSFEHTYFRRKVSSQYCKPRLILCDIGKLAIRIKQNVRMEMNFT